MNENSIRNQTAFEKSSQTTTEVMKTSGPHSVQGQETASDLNLEDPNFEAPDHDLQKPSKEEPQEDKPQRSRLQRAKELLGRGQAKLAEFQQKHPTIAKGLKIGTSLTPYGMGRSILVRVGGSVIRSLDAEDLKQAYDLAKEWGDDIRVFVDKAKQKMTREEKSAKNKPFHQVKEEERVKTVGRLQEQLTAEQRNSKYEYQTLSDSFNVSNTIQIAQIESKIAATKTVSLEEAISRKAHDPGLSHRLTRSALNADEFGKSYLIGTPEEKYDYFLHNAISHLGSDYFDLAKHPYRAIEFDKFAANRLYRDGFSIQKVEHTIKDGAFRPLFDANHPIESKFLQEYDQKTLYFYNQESNIIRDKTITWQRAQGGDVQKGNINPHELDQHQELAAHWFNRNLEKLENTEREALSRLEQYFAVDGKLNDHSTKTQYLLEYGRMMAFGKTPDERSISIGLTQAGHSREEIIEVLREHSIHFNESSKKLGQEADSVQRLIENHPVHKAETARVNQFRKDENIPLSERRLDVLEITHIDKEARPQQSQSPSHTPSPSRPSEGRNPEIER